MVMTKNYDRYLDKKATYWKTTYSIVGRIQIGAFRNSVTARFFIRDLFEIQRYTIIALFKIISSQQSLFYVKKYHFLTHFFIIFDKYFIQSNST